MVDGKLYGLPKVVETTILYYNKDLISEAEVPTNIEEWYELSKTATADGQYGLLALWDQIYYAQSVIGGYDGYIFAKDTDGKYDTADIGLNTDGAIEAASYIQKWYEEGLFPSGMIESKPSMCWIPCSVKGKRQLLFQGHGIWSHFPVPALIMVSCLCRNCRTEIL